MLFDLIVNIFHQIFMEMVLMYLGQLVKLFSCDYKLSVHTVLYANVFFHVDRIFHYTVLYLSLLIYLLFK